MKLFQKSIAVFLCLLIVFSLAGCGSDDKANAVGSPVGELVGSEYTNNRFLIRCALPENWNAASREERAAMIGVVLNAANDADFDKLMEQAGTWYDLYASSDDDTARISITVERAGPMSALSYTAKNLLDNMVTTYVQSLESSGMTNVVPERGTKEFMDGQREYLLITGDNGDESIYLEFFSFKSSRFYCTITLSARGTNQLPEIESMFSEVKELNYNH